MGRYSPNFIGNYLIGCARNNGDGEVVIHGERRVRWRTLVERSCQLAHALGAIGIGRGDKVALVFHNTPEFIEANFAAQLLGAIPVPVNYRFTAAELTYQVGHCDARVLLYDPRWSEAVEAALPELPAVETAINNYETLLEGQPAEDPRVSTSADDVAVIIYTGGTTGFPKGVMLTYGAHLRMYTDLLAGILSRGARLRLTREQEEGVAATFPLPGIKQMLPVLRTRPAKAFFGHPALLSVLKAGLSLMLTRPEIARLGYGYTINYMTPSLPFFHDASYQLLLLGPIVGNMCFILPEGHSLDVPAVLETIQRERPSFMANVPAGWKKLIAHPELSRYDLSSLRVGATGAGICPVELKREIMARLPGLIIIDMFGQTEMTPLTSFRIDADPSTLKERSVGGAIVQLRVVDEAGRNLPRGAVGEICYRSETQMKGYYKDHAATAAATTPDGWFRSGDLGYLDEEGEVRIVDRKSECINTGGEKVYPLEVEERLGRHAAVEQCCVIGVADDTWGHAVRAIVQLRPGASATADDLTDFARAELAGYKVPRSVVFVDELPLSPVGKILRAKIRQLHGAP
jgi:acyl-CoA synthetase (AMP-forming)/AMP-acid ligase II